MKYYETILVVSILTDTEPYEFEDFEALAYDVNAGPCSGHIVSNTVKELTTEELEKKCEEHGTDIGFFIMEDEDDI